MENFLSAYQDSIAYMSDPANLEDAAQLVAQYGITPNAAIARSAIPSAIWVCLTGVEMKAVLEDYYQVLYDADPASIGGALPMTPSTMACPDRLDRALSLLLPGLLAGGLAAWGLAGGAPCGGAGATSCFSPIPPRCCWPCSAWPGPRNSGGPLSPPWPASRRGWRAARSWAVCWPPSPVPAPGAAACSPQSFRIVRATPVVSLHPAGAAVDRPGPGACGDRRTDGAPGGVGGT